MAEPIEYTPEQLLSEVAYDEPLVAGDVRCHGGFVDGRYVSPRSQKRGPAILAWQERLRDEGGGLIHFSRDLMPPHYPSVEQARLLLQEGISAPIVRSLTVISIVEGFGAIIRDAPVPDWSEALVEDVGGTALAHLGSGLFEAHARDEAGHRDQGGHKQMWEAARDLALDKPEIPGDVLLRMMSGGGPRPRREPLFPNLAPRVEELIAMLTSIFVIEIFAENVFGWGEELLGDPEVSCEPEAARAMVSYIRSDERPHVEYLRTALSELWHRTLRTRDGAAIPGREVVGGLLRRQLRGVASERPRQQREQLQHQLHEEIQQGGGRTGDLERRFEALDPGIAFPTLAEERIEISVA
ncbi:MAG: hypothetical protein ACE5IL_00055 [Myxococcota bacterium]